MKSSSPHVPHALAQLTRALADKVLDALRACSVSEILGSLHDGRSPSLGPTPAIVVTRSVAGRRPSTKRAGRSKPKAVPKRVKPLDASPERVARSTPKSVTKRIKPLGEEVSPQHAARSKPDIVLERVEPLGIEASIESDASEHTSAP